MRFGFWFDYDQTYTFVGLFNELNKRVSGARASGFVVNDRYFAHAVENLPPGTSLTRFYDLVADGAKHVPDAAGLAEFREMDERYRLSRVAYSDRHLQSWRYDQLVGMYVYLIDAFRKYIDREKPDVFFFDCIASQYAHLLYLVLVEKGVKVIIPTLVGIENLFYLADDPFLNYGRVVNTFRDMQKGIGLPTAEERAFADQFISRIRQGGKPYVNLALVLEEQKFEVPGPGKFFKFVEYFKNYFLYDRYDPTLPSPYQRVKSIFRMRRNRRKAYAYFKSESEIGEDFIVFPLHFEPEIATLILSQYDQKSFIDIIVRQLPLACRLVVKEHPAMVGQRDWQFYDELASRYPNLVFVDPGVSLNRLMQQARAVVTLSGTAIIEAFAMRRPVIYTSRARFGGSDLGTFTNDLLNFGAVLSGASAQVPSEADVVNLLSALHRNCFRCKFSEPLGDPDVLGKENLGTIATAVLDRLQAA